MVTITGGNFVLTGKMRMMRTEVIEMIERHGGFVDQDVKSHTTALVWGEGGRPSMPKRRKAERLGVTIISEDELFEALGLEISSALDDVLDEPEAAEPEPDIEALAEQGFGSW